MIPIQLVLTGDTPQYIRYNNCRLNCTMHDEKGSSVILHTDYRIVSALPVHKLSKQEKVSDKGE